MWLRFTAVLPLLIFLWGCEAHEMAWLMRQAAGQVDVFAASRPVNAVLAEPRVSPLLRRRLALVYATREFAARLGLNVSQQYRRVTFLDSPATVFVVSAAPADSLMSIDWTYPLVGALPYRGFFSLEEAEQQADALALRGLDVDVRPVMTYSLLGVLPEPLVSPVLFGGDELHLVETILHELAHATLFVSGAGAFNEGLATFIGRAGRRIFVEQTFGTDSAIVALMEARQKDEDAYAQAVAALAFDLRVLYAQSPFLKERDLRVRKRRLYRLHAEHWQHEVVPLLSSYRMRQARLPHNNAELSAYGVYSLKQQLYEDAWNACDRQMRCLLHLLRSVASAPDPEQTLFRQVQEMQGSRKKGQ